ncbi:phosphoglycolate phosphatase [Lachnospiraceae bacterium NE2001]|nr:phosphoglycolate phosphatase [Lachnospiraceae bacterium NE2001]
MIRSIIFDLDGTLLDTSVGVLSSVQKMIEHFGLHNLDDDDMRSFIGPPINKNLERLYGMAPDKAMEAMSYFREEYPKGDIFRAEHYEGMDELLYSLKDLGFKVGVSTYKREDMAKTLLEEKGLAKYFDVIHGSNAASDMTKADIVNLTIRDLGYEPDETVMVGDSDNDAIGAEEAGALFIGVTYGFGFNTPEEIEQYDPFGIAESPLDILDLFC